MQIVIPLYDDLTALDAIGPYEVLSRLPGAQVVFAAEEPGPKRTDNGMLRLVADAALADVPAPDVVCVPGGVSTRRLAAEGGPLVAWTRAAHATSTWTTSVCTGALVLGAAGVLDGLEATTHFLSRELLRRYGARPVPDRVVFAGERVVTAAGVSSGIDMALALAARIAGPDVARAIQLAIEYDPEPPFDAGSPEKAGPELLVLVRAGVQARTAAADAR